MSTTGGRHSDDDAARARAEAAAKLTNSKRKDDYQDRLKKATEEKGGKGGKSGKD